MNPQSIYIGCAGWNVGREHAPQFPAQGTHLQRYSAQFNCVEINSSFYRPHRHQTYVRWAESVPAGFRFSVKIPKQITHELRLANSEPLLEEFLGQCCGLGQKLGCLLVQLPPSLAFDEAVVEVFFTTLRAQYSGPLVLEPRHPSWVEAGALLMAYGVSQAAVDPSRISTDVSPMGTLDVQYWRLHGSPRIYFSAYAPTCLNSLAHTLRAAAAKGVSVYCLFDNTASGAALGNALELKTLLASAD